MWSKKKKDTICSKCKRVLHPNEKRVVCCDKENPSCQSCSKHPCVWCGGSYKKKLVENICSQCEKEVSSDVTFIMEANNKIICSQCAAVPYRWHYRLFINKNIPLQVPITNKKLFSFEEMKTFFKGYCIDCGFKTIKGYNLKQNVIVCDSCYEKKEFYNKVILKCDGCFELKRIEESHQGCISSTLKKSIPLDKIGEKEKIFQMRNINQQSIIKEMTRLTSSNAEDIVLRIPLKLQIHSEQYSDCFKCKSLLRKDMIYRVTNSYQDLNENILKKTNQKNYCKLCYINEIQMMKRQFTRQLFPWTPNGSFSLDTSNGGIIHSEVSLQ